MYYVNHNACATLAAAEEVADLYRAAGVPADILTEEEYFEQLKMVKH
jgi:hypothetical protein